MLPIGHIVSDGHTGDELLKIEGMSQKRIRLTDIEDVTDIVRKEIVSYMQDKELSQYRVAKMCGWTPSYVIRILDSKGATLNKLFEVANKIGMKLTLLIERK